MMRSSQKLVSLLLFLYLIIPSFAHVPPAPPCTTTTSTPPVQNKGATATHHATKATPTTPPVQNKGTTATHQATKATPTTPPVQNKGTTATHQATKATPTTPPVQNNGATATHHSTIEFVDPSLKGWCKTANFPDLCTSIIAPHMNEKSTLYNVMDISIRSTINITMKTLSVCRELAKAPPSSVQAATLNDILSNIAKALDYYKKAHDALIQHHWEVVNTYLGAAHKFCLIGFQGHGFFKIHDEIHLFMLRNLINKLTKMNSNCIGLGLLF